MLDSEFLIRRTQIPHQEAANFPLGDPQLGGFAASWKGEDPSQWQKFPGGGGELPPATLGCMAPDGFLCSMFKDQVQSPGCGFPVL